MCRRGVAGTLAEMTIPLYHGRVVLRQIAARKSHHSALLAMALTSTPHRLTENIK